MQKCYTRKQIIESIKRKAAENIDLLKEYETSAISPITQLMIDKYAKFPDFVQFGKDKKTISFSFRILK